MDYKVLIVDDAELNREMLAEVLKEEFQIIEFADGQDAIHYMESHNDILAMLLDLRMPKVDGFGVLDYMKKSHIAGFFPVLVISAESSPEIERKCLKLGVSDFIRKPFDSEVVLQRVRNVVDLFAYRYELEAKVQAQTNTLRVQNKMLQEQAELAKQNNERIIDILGTVVEYRNLESGEHIKRVKSFTRILAEEVALHYPEYNLSDERINMIVAASALHDIGKIAISDAVLLKPGRLTKDEFEYIKSHTVRGCDIIQQIEGAWDKDYKRTSYEICRHHHERYDGKGYPDGLVGESIPISAQIVSVADVYDALVSERVYKDAFDKDTAYHMILKGDCGVFSPKIMECFRRSKERFEEQLRKNES